MFSLFAPAAFSFKKNDLYLVGGVIVLLLISNSLHEAGHALVAWWAGDKREEIRRRITLNPLNHMHWFLTIVMPILTYWFFQFPMGGAKPVMVDAGKIGPRRMALVAMAGPLGNLIFALVCATVAAALMAWDVIDDIDAQGSILFRVLNMSVWFSALLVIVNLVPLPPADGSRILAMFMPEKVRRVYYLLVPITVVLLAVGLFWISGNLQRFIPAVGPGFPQWFMKQNARTEDFIFDFAAKIRHWRGM